MYPKGNDRSPGDSMCQKIEINFYISPVINVKTVLPTIVVSTLLINLIEQIINFKQLKSVTVQLPQTLVLK